MATKNKNLVIAEQALNNGKISQSEFDCFVANLNAKNYEAVKATLETWKANGKI